jgi:curved DNA-binding protein
VPVAFKDYYRTLGVERDASPEEIKKAFRKLARKHHPDVAADKATAEEKFKEINEAYEVLGDPEQRRKYDQLGPDGPNRGGFQEPPGGFGAGGFRTSRDAGGAQEFHFTGTGFSDFFEQHFAGGDPFGFSGAGRAEARESGRPRRGSDVEGDILVTLEEAMHGTTREISMRTINLETGQPETHSFKVRIPPGATDGRRIRVPGQGEPGTAGGPAGDIFLRVRHAAHPDFSTHDADIFRTLEIAPWDAVLGTEAVISTLDGSIKVRIPPGAENGRKFRVRGRGLPKGKAGARGDFYVVLAVELPTSIRDEERVHWERLRELSKSETRRPSAA